MAKHVADKLFWTPLKMVALAALAAAVVLVPTMHMALHRQSPLEDVTEVMAPSSVPAASAAFPPVQDHDGLHLDDAKRWRTVGNLPSKISPTRIEVALQGQGYPRTFALLNQQSWQVDREPASFRLAFALSPKPSRQIAFRIEANVNLKLNSSERQTITRLQLRYEGEDATLRTELIEPSLGRVTLKNSRPLQATRHTLELAVGKEEWMTWLDGKPLYRGAHGLKAESVVFLAGALLCDESEAVNLSIEDLKIGKAELPDGTVPPGEF